MLYVALVSVILTAGVFLIGHLTPFDSSVRVNVVVTCGAWPRSGSPARTSAARSGGGEVDCIQYALGCILFVSIVGGVGL